MIKFIDLHKQYLSIKGEIDRAIASVIEESAFIGGKYVADFEETFAEYLGVNSCLGVANGTDALEIAIEALDLPKESEIIVPANTFIADSEAVTRSGHKVVFCDCAADYLIDLDQIETLITSKTKAVIAVHLYGLSCDMDRLRNICDRHQLKIIEDCSQAQGAKYKGKLVGGFGDLATFSFYPGKNLGAYGDGGAIVSNDKELIKQCRLIANHGRLEKYNHEIEGRNSRLDGVQAAILGVKLAHLNDWVARKNQLALIYREQLKDVRQLSLPVVYDDRCHGMHLFVVRLENRNELKKYLADFGIETVIHYPKVLPSVMAYKQMNLDLSHFDNAVKVSDEILSLPLYAEMTESELVLVCDKIKEFYDKD